MNSGFLYFNLGTPHEFPEMMMIKCTTSALRSLSLPTVGRFLCFNSGTVDVTAGPGVCRNLCPAALLQSRLKRITSRGTFH